MCFKSAFSVLVSGLVFYTSTVIGTPQVVDVLPHFGPVSGNTEVTISGTGFKGATAVLFGSEFGTKMKVQSDTKITVKAPIGIIGTVDVTVVTGHETSDVTPADYFTYTGHWMAYLAANGTLSSVDLHERKKAL